MSHVVLAAAGLVIAGPLGALLGAALPMIRRRLSQRTSEEPPARLVLLLLYVHLKSGLSVLAALMATSAALPAARNLARVTRVAIVSGLESALQVADDGVGPLLSQLARAQRSGASLSWLVLQMLETELEAERSRSIARARTLPVRLMVPVTLLMLPGMVLFLYAPSMLSMFTELTGAFT